MRPRTYLVLVCLPRLLCYITYRYLCPVFYFIFFFIFFLVLGSDFWSSRVQALLHHTLHTNSQCTHPSVDVTAYADFSLASLITIYNCVRRRGFIRYYFSSLLFFIFFASSLPNMYAYYMHMRSCVIICFVLQFFIWSPAKALIAWLADAAVFSVNIYVYILCSRCSVAAVLLLAFCLGTDLLAKCVGVLCLYWQSSSSSSSFFLFC